MEKMNKEILLRQQYPRVFPTFSAREAGERFSSVKDKEKGFKQSWGIIKNFINKICA